VLGSAGRMVGTGDVRKVECEDKKRGRGKEKERWIKRSRKYRRGGYTVRIKSRSHGAVLFRVRCLVCPLRTQHEIVRRKASARKSSIVFRYLVANSNIGLPIAYG